MGETEGVGKAQHRAPQLLRRARRIRPRFQNARLAPCERATTFSHHRFQRLNIDRLWRDDVLQPTVLFLELLEPLHLTELHPAVLRLPPVVRLVGDPVHAARVCTLRPASPSLTIASICSSVNALRFIGLLGTEGLILRVADRRGQVPLTCEACPQVTPRRRECVSGIRPATATLLM